VDPDLLNLDTDPDPAFQVIYGSGSNPDPGGFDYQKLKKKNSAVYGVRGDGHQYQSGISYTVPYKYNYKYKYKYK
jgi:hypothetical protein